MSKEKSLNSWFDFLKTEKLVASNMPDNCPHISRPTPSEVG